MLFLDQKLWKAVYLTKKLDPSLELFENNSRLGSNYWHIIMYFPLKINILTNNFSKSCTNSEVNSTDNSIS